MHWFFGPTRKPVEHSAITLPSTYMAAKLRIPDGVAEIRDSVPWRHGKQGWCQNSSESRVSKWVVLTMKLSRYPNAKQETKPIRRCVQHDVGST